MEFPVVRGVLGSHHTHCPAVYSLCFSVSLICVDGRIDDLRVKGHVEERQGFVRACRRGSKTGLVVELRQLCARRARRYSYPRFVPETTCIVMLHMHWLKSHCLLFFVSRLYDYKSPKNKEIMCVQ